MTTRSERPTLVVVVGATGSGKTDLSIRLAEHYSSPIVSTDSRQIYKGMPIGTAQPTAEQLSRVEHHFIAERLPQQDFNCGEYETETLRRLETLFERHPLVVAAGGSGLYIQALCDGMDDLPTADKELRRKLKERLDTEGIEALADELYRLDPQCHATVDRCNPARVMRALEVCLSSGRQYSQLRTGRRRGTSVPNDQDRHRHRAGGAVSPHRSEGRSHGSRRTRRRGAVAAAAARLQRSANGRVSRDIRLYRP